MDDPQDMAKRLANVNEDLKALDKCMMEIRNICSIMKLALVDISNGSGSITPELIAVTALGEIVPYAMELDRIVELREKHRNAQA